VADGIEKGIQMAFKDYKPTGYSRNPFSVIGEVGFKIGQDITKLARSEDIQERDIARIVADIVTGSSLVTGSVGAAPVSEWVYPALYNSRYKAVKLLTDAEIDHRIRTQHRLDKALQRYYELQRKKKAGTISNVESVEFNRMFRLKHFTDIMTRYNNPIFAKPVKDAVDDYYEEYLK
jgi:hypothetical protein